MKTAEEWMNSFGKFPTDLKQEDELWRLSKLPENVLPKVNFWNSVITESDIEQIQLNAAKAGMKLAAEIVGMRAKEFVGNTQKGGTRSSEVYFYGIGCERACKAVENAASTLTLEKLKEL